MVVLDTRLDFLQPTPHQPVRLIISMRLLWFFNYWDFIILTGYQSYRLTAAQDVALVRHGGKLPAVHLSLLPTAIIQVLATRFWLVTHVPALIMDTNMGVEIFDPNCGDPCTCTKHFSLAFYSHPVLY